MDKVKTIKVLKPLVDSYVDYANISMKEEDDDIVEALEMALEALKALDVPDTNVGDMISRQVAIEAIDEWFKKVRSHMSAYEYDSAYTQGEIDAYVTAIDTLKTLPAVNPEPKWIPCSERLPSETVIATVETKTFKHRYVCEAVWIPRWTRKVLFDEWEDCSEYKEDDDEYYALEGWYERVHNWDEYAYVAIDDNVIAWMPLPTSYKGEWGDSE